MRPITPNMRIETIIRRHPGTERVFRKHGLECVDCHQARFETVHEGARVHELDLRILLDELNQAAADTNIARWAHLPLAPRAARR